MLHTVGEMRLLSNYVITFITLTYLCAFLSISLVLSGDIETNPGPKPPKFPCGHCKKACCDYQGAMSSILCESCNTWYHAVCVNIDTDLLSVLERSSCPWECPNCGLPNFSATLFDSVILDSDITIASSEESPCSTPLPTSLLSSSPSKNMQPIQSQVSNLRIVAINFQSVCAKKEEFWCLIDAAKPDVIIGSETWLKPDISDSEIFPPGYHVYRKDRADGYGGVLLGISTSLNSNKIEIETEGEFVAAKVLGSKHAIIFAAAYRPPRSDQTYMDTVNQNLSTLCHKFSNMPIWIGGDMNLTDIEWETEQLTTNQYTHSISYSFWIP